MAGSGGVPCMSERSPSGSGCGSSARRSRELDREQHDDEKEMQDDRERERALRVEPPVAGRRRGAHPGHELGRLGERHGREGVLLGREAPGRRPRGEVFLPFDGFVVQTNDGEIADGVSPREGARLSRGPFLWEVHATSLRHVSGFRALPAEAGAPIMSGAAFKGLERGHQPSFFCPMRAAGRARRRIDDRKEPADRRGDGEPPQRAPRGARAGALSRGLERRAAAAPR